MLKLAATEPAYRPEFFQLLLAADVWVPGASTQAHFAADTPVDLQH
ncbi:enhanced serine sensitivity protein SseB|nr:enhanced serine sensitivity protein SseB [Candidatus Pantoea persica]